MLKQFLRRTLWVPVGVASVSGTLYLAHFLYEKNKLANTISAIPVKEPEQEESASASPDEASSNGTTDEASESKQESGEEGDEDTQEKSPPSPPPAPTPPKPEGPTSSKENSQSENSGPLPEGTLEIKEFIRVKMIDLKDYGIIWSSGYNTELLSSWKVNTTVNDLLNAIEQFLNSKESDSES